MGWGLPPRGISERQKRAWIGGNSDGETVGSSVVSGLASLGTPMLPNGSFFNPYTSRMQSGTSIGPNMMVAPERDHEFAMYQQHGRDAASGLMHDTALRGLANPSNLPEQSSIDKKLGIPQPQHSALAGGKPYEEYWDYGQVEGPGGPRDDRAGVKRLPASGDLAALSDGEAVLTAKAVGSMNRDFFGGDPNGVEKYQLTVDPKAGANQTDRSERIGAVGGKEALKSFRDKNAKFFSGGKVMKMKKVRKCAGGSPLAALDDGYEALKYNVGEAIGPSIDAARSRLNKVGGAINRAAISALTSNPKPVAVQQPLAPKEVSEPTTGLIDVGVENQTNLQGRLKRDEEKYGLKGGKPIKKYKGGKKSAGGSPLSALGKSEPVRKLAGGTPEQLDMFSQPTGRTPYDPAERLARVRAAQAAGVPNASPLERVVIDRMPQEPIGPAKPTRGQRAVQNYKDYVAGPKLSKADKLGSLKNVGKWVARAAVPLAVGYNAAKRIGGTDTDTYRKRLGMELAPGEENTFWGDLGVRAKGAAYDIPAIALDSTVVGGFLGAGDALNSALYGENAGGDKDPLENMGLPNPFGGRPRQGVQATQPAQPPQPPKNPVEQAIAAQGAATPEQEQTVQNYLQQRQQQQDGIGQVGNTFFNATPRDDQAEAITAMRGRLRERENNMTNDVTSAYNAWKANPNMFTEQRYRALKGQQDAIGDRNAMLGVQASAPGSILHQLLGLDAGVDADGSGSSGSSGDGTGSGRSGKSGGINQLSAAVNAAKENERKDAELKANMDAKSVELAKEFGVDQNDIMQLWNTVGSSGDPAKDVAIAKLLSRVKAGVIPNKTEVAPDYLDPNFLLEVADAAKQGRYGNLEDVPVGDAYDIGGAPAWFGAWLDKASPYEKVVTKKRHLVRPNENLTEDANLLAGYIAAQQAARNNR